MLVDAIKEHTPAEKITALLTDTNFDGIRNRLDGRGTKRGNQIDQALIMAQSPDSGKPLNMDQISANIIAYLDKRGTKWGSDKPTNAETFANWLAADINNAKLVQVALMDSPVEAVDIMKYGADAMAKTLENHGLTPEEKKALEDKINTDPATKELSEEARETLMANLSGHLLAKMKEPGINANVNGLGVGVNMPLNQVLKGLSLSLGTGTTLEGQPFAGVSFAWNDEVLKWKTGNASIGINAGTNLGVIPVYGFRGGIEQDLNAKKVL